MNQDADVKSDLKTILQEHLDKAASSLFLAKSFGIIDESADNKESCISAAVRISKRVALFIDRDLAQKVYESLIVAIDKKALPQGTKRRYPRVTFCKKVDIRRNGARYELNSENLSEGGMYIRTDEPFPTGSEIEMSLPLGIRTRIHVTGVVVYVSDASADTLRLPPGMAVEFRNVRDEDIKILRDYIQRATTQDVLGRQDDAIVEPLSSY